MASFWDSWLLVVVFGGRRQMNTLQRAFAEVDLRMGILDCKPGNRRYKGPLGPIEDCGE